MKRWGRWGSGYRRSSLSRLEIERDGKRYAYRLTGKGTKVALTFVLQPTSPHRPNSKLEAAYYKADASIRNIVQLLEAA